MDNCKCQQHTSVDLVPKSKEANGQAEKGGRGQIVSLVVGYDLTSRIANFVTPIAFHGVRAIRGVLTKLGEKRMERIREEDNKMLAKEERNIREQREKEKKEEKKPDEIHPEHPHRLARSRDPATDSVRTAPMSVCHPIPLPLSPYPSPHLPPSPSPFLPPSPSPSLPSPSPSSLPLSPIPLSPLSPSLPSPSPSSLPPSPIPLSPSPPLFALIDSAIRERGLKYGSSQHEPRTQATLLRLRSRTSSLRTHGNALRIGSLRLRLRILRLNAFGPTQGLAHE